MKKFKQGGAKRSVGSRTGGSRFGRSKFGGQTGRGGFSDKRRGCGGGREAPQMHPATCSSCNRATEVPFRPMGEKPVYCRDCFRSAGDGSRERGDRSAGYDRPKFAAPRPASAGTGSDSRIDRQIDSLHEKLDRILMEIEEIQDKLG